MIPAVEAARDLDPSPILAPIPFGVLLGVVARRTLVEASAILSDDRRARVVCGREILALAASDPAGCNLSWPELARAAGRRSHSSLRYAAHRAARDPFLRREAAAAIDACRKLGWSERYRLEADGLAAVETARLRRINELTN
jgi:chromosomal replication initiation ATPase DnaA